MAKNGRNRDRRESVNHITVDPAAQRQHVEERAYTKFLERGAVPGHDVEDWLAAEREILADTKTAVDE